MRLKTLPRAFEIVIAILWRFESLPRFKANRTRKQFRTNGNTGQNRETSLRGVRTIRPLNWIIIIGIHRLGDFTSGIGVGMDSADLRLKGQSAL